jgi:hypothetical protein
MSSRARGAVTGNAQGFQRIDLSYPVTCPNSYHTVMPPIASDPSRAHNAERSDACVIAKHMLRRIQQDLEAQAMATGALTRSSSSEFPGNSEAITKGVRSIQLLAHRIPRLDTRGQT